MNNKRYWLKVKENFFDDDEIVFLKSQTNGYEYIYLWMRLLLKCLRSNEENNCGFLRINEKVPYDINMLSNLFGMNVDVVRTGIEVFKKMGMLEILDDGTFYIEAVQKMIGKEGESAERMRISRDKKKTLQLSQSDTEVTEKCDNIIRVEEDKDKEEDVKKEKRIAERNIIPPTLEMVTNYCIERNNGINPIKFMSKYEANGWMVGKNKMKDWQASVRYWETSDFNENKKQISNDDRFSVGYHEKMRNMANDKQ
jgi:predicted phage replisome organizer